MIYLARKIAKTFSMLAPNFRENNAYFELMHYAFFISILIF
jgi:hypothetical protein